jgi:hypothetical protein
MNWLGASSLGLVAPTGKMVRNVLILSAIFAQVRSVFTLPYALLTAPSNDHTDDKLQNALVAQPVFHSFILYDNARS